MDDPRFHRNAYITDGKILWRVVQPDEDGLWVEDAAGIWHTQSRSWHFRQHCMSVEEIRACTLVRVAPRVSEAA